jgi:peptidoglycan hydrolase CwlO-like protein
MITVFYTLMALVVVQMRKQVKDLESQIRDLNKEIEDTARDIYQRTDEVQSNLDEAERDLVSLMDSRFDKFENKITNKKEILKG